ncbi:MAG: lipoprotein signal peptidase [Leptospiraceae bacterium]|nr:lipoprotein signal peptidase [Leptospiraceae bacterium]
MQYFEQKFLEVVKPSYILFIFVGVMIDLSTKYWVIQNYSAEVIQPVMGDFFWMALTFNTGFVFGMFQDNSIISLIFTAIAIVFLIGYRWKNYEIGNPWGWNLVMVGAFGNFIDKFFVKMPPGGGIKLGFSAKNPGEFIGVVDFLSFDWPDFLLFKRWPAFNFADSCVTVGLVILIFTMNTALEKTSSAKKSA